MKRTNGPTHSRGKYCYVNNAFAYLFPFAHFSSSSSLSGERDSSNSALARIILTTASRLDAAFLFSDGSRLSRIRFGGRGSPAGALGFASSCSLGKTRCTCVPAKGGSGRAWAVCRTGCCPWYTAPACTGLCWVCGNEGRGGGGGGGGMS